MEHCPTCNARYSGKTVCHRCKTDLGPLIDIENRAKGHLEAAIAAFHSNDFHLMFFHAKRSCSLKRTPEANSVLACAALLVRQYDLAVLLYPKRTAENFLKDTP